MEEFPLDDQPRKKRRKTHMDGSLPGDIITMKKKQRFNELVQQELEMEKKSKEFHAQPLPTLSPDVNLIHTIWLKRLPVVHAKQPTHPIPFHLATDERGEAYQDQFYKKIEEEDDMEKRQAEFKAQPLPGDVVFVPKRSTKPLTQVENVELVVDKRLRERKKFDEMVKDNERLQEERRLQAELENQVNSRNLF